MPDTVERKDVEGMTVPELRAELDEAGVDYAKSTQKAKLQERVAAARAEAATQAEPDQAPVVDGDAVEVDEAGAELTPEAAEEEIGKALALREQTPQPQSALPSPAEFQASMAIAEKIASTTFVPEAYRGRPADVLAAILFGREIGLGPMNALRDIYMIDGRPALAAHRQLALLRKGGVQILESETTRGRAFIRARRADTGEVMAVEFSMDEAEKIQTSRGPLVQKANWKNYPADMLWARCVGRLTRRLGSDLLNGLPPYVAEEVADFTGWGVSYDGEAGPTFTARPAAEDHRQQHAGKVETPRSWPEIFAWAEPYGDPLGWAEWVRDASEQLFNTRDRGKLTRDQLNILGQKAAGAIIALRDTVDPGRMPPPNREEVQKAWASVLNGAVLLGPSWSLSPEETAAGAPSYWEANGIDPPPAAPDAASTEQTGEAAEAAPDESPDGDGAIDWPGEAP